MSNNHVVVQWTIITGTGMSAYNIDFEVYELENGFEFVIDMGVEGMSLVVLNEDRARTLAERLLLRLDNRGTE